MDSKPLSVLVTGSSGFIGTHVVRQLHAAGHRVTALDILKPKFPLPDGVEFRQWFDADVVAVHSVEIAAAHSEWGYAGRVDLVATLKSTGRPTVIDFKTQKVRRDKDGGFKPILHDTWPLQLEAYRQALASRDKGLTNAAIASVVIGSTEPVPVVVKVWDDADTTGFFRAFLAARELWVWQKSYCPVKDSPNNGDEPPAAPVPA